MTTSCHCIALRRVSRTLTARYDAALAPFGITVAQYSLLRQLQTKAAMSLTALGAAAALDRSTIGRNIRVLERAGLVASGRGVEDEREAAVALTEKGRTLLQAARPAWQACQDEVEGRLGADRLAELKDILDAL